MTIEGTYEILFPFSQFEVERILGKLPSGRAVSWLSRSKESGQRVVIKEVSLADSFGHEAWIERQWNGWARIHEIRTGNAAAIYIRDYIEGHRLGLPESVGDTHAALTRIAAICATLAPLHALSAAHGRLKPGNIIVDASDQIILTDPTFDPSRAASQPDEEDTADASIAFDPYYISPEQIRDGLATPASDVYSLGCILFEQLSGKPPFRNVVPLMVCYQHASTSPPSFESMGVHVLRDVEQLVMRMLAKAPADRPQSAMELLDLIEPLLDPAYSPAAMTGAFTLSLKDLQEGTRPPADEPPAPAPVEPAPQPTLAAPSTPAEQAPAEPPPAAKPASAADSDEGIVPTGTLVISRRELKRLIEKADNKTYAPGDTPVLDPDERLPIPLVRSAEQERPRPIDKATTSVLAAQDQGGTSEESPTRVMSTVQEREAAILHRPAEGEGEPSSPVTPARGGGLQTLLLIYGVVVTLLLLAAVGVIVFLLLQY